ncbi:MAG: hypothetical protein JRI87_06555 [Deltaproteobacteria bacterium]|nr:hypothetical protein [Deltaproteobacteria bacterium]
MIFKDKRKNRTMEKIGRIFICLIVFWIIITGLIIEDGCAQEWEKVNYNGFGDVDNKSSFPMEIFKDDLYIGLWNDAGVEIWMTPEGTNANWNQMNVNGFGAPENSHSTSMEVFNDKLYVGVLNEGGGELWLNTDGTSWKQVNIAEFSSDNICVRAMATFAPYEDNKHLYMGTDNEEGGQLWMTNNGIDWLLLEDDGFGDADNTSVYSMGILNSYLYLGTVNQQSGTQIWKTKGGITWAQTNSDGFGYSSNQVSYSMCNFKDYLYVGTVNQLTGTQVWRTSDGSSWLQSNEDGFGDPSNSCSYSMTVFNNRLYVGTGDVVARVWRTEDGVIWEQVNSDSFDSSDNTVVHSLIVFGDYLYAGTGNKWGTEIWRYKETKEETTECLLEQVFKNKPQALDALRTIRDTVKSRSLRGSEYVELYYRYLSEISEIYGTYPEIREKTNEVLKNLLPRILLISRGEKRRLGSLMNGALLSLLDAYARVASHGLRLAVKKIKKELKNDSLSNLLQLK